MIWVQKNKLKILISLTIISFVGLTIPRAYYLLNPIKPANAPLKKVIKPEHYGGGGLPQPGPVFQGAPPPIPLQQPAQKTNILPPAITGTPEFPGPIPSDDTDGELNVEPKIKPKIPKPKRLDEEEWYLKTKAVTSIIADIVSGFFPICTAFFSVKIWFRQRRERKLNRQVS